jgi:dethiobiotin synthetase
VTTIFVTSSGTGLGKTFVTAQLLGELARAGYRARALKPIASGFDPTELDASDTGILLRAQGLPPTPANLDAVSPWRFAAPLSPDMAAAREDRSIPFAELVAFAATASSADVTLVEGVGGVMAPLTSEHTVLDWIAALGSPALLVVGSYLGALSHSLTAAAALRERGIALAGVVVSESLEQPVPAEETAATLERFVRAPTRVLPRARRAPLLPLIAPLLARRSNEE